MKYCIMNINLKEAIMNTVTFIYNWEITNKKSQILLQECVFSSGSMSDVYCTQQPLCLSDSFTAADQLSSPTKDNKRLLSKSTQQLLPSAWLPLSHCQGPPV